MFKDIKNRPLHMGDIVIFSFMESINFYGVLISDNELVTKSGLVNRADDIKYCYLIENPDENELALKEKCLQKYQIELNNDEIINLKSELSTKDKIINKLQTEKEKLKTELQKFKGFWHKLIKHFQNKIGFDKDEKYKYVSYDLYKNGIFDDNDNRIVNDVNRAIKTVDELNNTNIKKKNNMELK